MKGTKGAILLLAAFVCRFCAFRLPVLIASVRRPKLVTGRRFDPEQVADEVVPASANHIGLIRKTVTAVREQKKIEIFIGFNQFVHH